MLSQDVAKGFDQREMALVNSEDAPGGDDHTTEAPEIGSSAVAGMGQDLSRSEKKRTPQFLHNLRMSESLDLSVMTYGTIIDYYIVIQ